MYKAALGLLVGMILSLGGGANALTFKDDGSVVQKSGKVEVESYANRFRRKCRNPTDSGLNRPEALKMLEVTLEMMLFYPALHY